MREVFVSGDPLLIKPPASHAGEVAVRAFLDTLEQECSSYCLLGGYEQLPFRLDSDIDFMVCDEDFERLPQFLKLLAEKLEYRLIQAIQHEATACYYIIANSEPGKVAYLHPDSCSDYHRKKRRWLIAEDVLQRRKWHPNGFWVPSSADAFSYYLIKRVSKRSLEAKHCRQLSQIFNEDPSGCSEAIARRFPPSATQRIVEAAASGDWKSVSESVEEFSTLLMAGAPSKSLKLWLGEAKRVLRRWIYPTGMYVAILGPDGSGKSSVIEQYLPAMEPAFRRSATFHLRPRLLRGSSEGQNANTDPHASPPRGAIMSTAKLLYLWFDYVIGYFYRIRPLMVRSTFVVFDRYYHDLLIDARRFRYGGPKWLAQIIGHLIPLPDLILILDAPAGVLQSRKQEVSYCEAERQSSAYRFLPESAQLRTRSVLIDATQSVDRVVHQCVRATFEWLEMRTSKRLRI
jgi:thymidylate kinase